MFPRGMFTAAFFTAGFFGPGEAGGIGPGAGDYRDDRAMLVSLGSMMGMG